MSDPFECLPEPVLQHILSLLLPSLREAARAALVSRSWWLTWSTFPFCDFDFRHFVPEGRYSFDRISPEVLEINDRFLGFVDRSVSRLRDRGLRLPRLRIWARLFESDERSRALFDKWIDMALGDCAQELNITVHKFHGPYSVPVRAFSSDCLKTLTLDGSGFTVPPNAASSVNLSSLKSLVFREIRIDDQMLQKLLRGCPLLENLTLYRCVGLKQMKISGLSNLRMVDVTGGVGVDRVEIEVPNLEKLEFSVTIRDADEILLDGCRQLKHLTFMSIMASQELFEELLSKFPLLESLTIRYCMSFERIRISHPMLEKIEVLKCPKLMEIEIDAPKLLSFRYCSVWAELPVIRMKNPASVPNCEAEFSLCFPGPFRFGQLREFLTGSCAFTSLSFTGPFKVEVQPENDMLASVPCHIGHLNLKVDAPQSSHAAILNGLLSICHPTSMRVNQCDPNSSFLKFICRKLAKREEGTKKCLCSRRTRCWLHKLKGVEIERITESDHRGPLDWTTLFGLLPTLNLRNEVCFRLHW